MFNASINEIADFLSVQADDIGTYGTLNCYRSAISLITLYNISDNKTLHRFFKGIEKLKPNRPKYNVTWDPSKVLQFIAGLRENQEISIQNLSKKLVTLLALITAQRIQTLSLIKLENIKCFSDKIEIRIPDRIKNSSLNQCQPLLTIPFFEEHPEICVASTLKNYIERTAEHRNSNLENFLFLTHKKPIHVATKQTLSRWVKETLHDSGIDTTLFSSHSTRHASTSTAKLKNIIIDIIRKTAGWSSKSNVSAKFYNRPICNDQDFANAIVQDYCATKQN